MSSGQGAATSTARVGSLFAGPAEPPRHARRAAPTVAWGLPHPRPGIGLVGLLLLGGYTAVALAAPRLAPYDPTAFVGRTLERPSPAHWLGTNDAGQDVLSELVYGTRASLGIAVAAASGSLAAAALVGTAAGYRRGWADTLLMRLVDVLLALPHLPLMILLAAYLPPSAGTTILVIAALGWPVPARIVRAQTLTLRAEGYVTAARQLGARAPYVVRRHLLPALGPVLAATFVAQAGRAVGLEAGLAFLGLGDPLLKSWGAIMRAAVTYSGIYFTPSWTWWLLPASLNISLLILAFTLAGIGLEERLDPRLRRR